MTDIPIPPRPHLRDPEIIAAALEPVLGDVVQWCLDTGHSANTDSVRSELMKTFDSDAFNHCTLLDQIGWLPDARLVAILDDISVEHALQQASIEWVRRYGVTVPFSAGDRVSTPQHKAARVVDVFPATAQIVIQPDDEKERWAGQPKSGWIINPESAIKIAGAIGDQVSA